MGMGINHWEWERMGLKKYSRSSLLHLRDAWMTGYRKGGEIVKFIDWKRCASLAIVWNNYKAGENRIFNAENDKHLQVGDEIHAVPCHTVGWRLSSSLVRAASHGLSLSDDNVGRHFEVMT